MNPQHLFALSSAQRQKYEIQPDFTTAYHRDQETEEFESPNFYSKAYLRFWYNVDPVSYHVHWHDAQEIIVPLENGYTVTVRDVSYQLEPGDIFLIPPGEPHALDSPSTGNRLIFILSLDTFCQISDFLPIRLLLSNPIHITADSHPGIYEREISLLMEAASLYWGDSPIKQVHIYARMMEFYAAYMEGHAAASLKSGPAFSANMTQRMSRLLEYLQCHYSENISLDTAADLAGISKFYFSKLFRRHTGKTYYEYLTFLRIHFAEEQLADTGESIAEIALKCGYADASAFTRSFRKHKGCTPSEYRKRSRHLEPA